MRILILFQSLIWTKAIDTNNTYNLTLGNAFGIQGDFFISSQQSSFNSKQLTDIYSKNIIGIN